MIVLHTEFYEIPWNDHFDQLAEDYFVIIDGYLSEEECSSLRNICFQYREAEAFRLAGIGTEGDFHKDRSIRSDRILWIDRGIQAGPVQRFLERADWLRILLNRACFLGLAGYEFHFAHYPPGSFYRRHLDQFDHRNNRIISAITYLNEGWQGDDGGSLLVYQGDKVTEILPVGGRLVLMRSDILEHEVALSHRDRYSITGWFMHMPPGLGFLT